MKIRSVLIAGPVAAAVAAVIVSFQFRAHVLSSCQEMLVSSGMTLTTKWLELKPKTPMKNAGDWNELVHRSSWIAPSRRWLPR